MVLKKGVWGGFVGLVFSFKQILIVGTYEAAQKNAGQSPNEVGIKILKLLCSFILKAA